MERALYAQLHRLPWKPTDMRKVTWLQEMHIFRTTRYLNRCGLSVQATNLTDRLRSEDGLRDSDIFLALPRCCRGVKWRSTKWFVFPGEILSHLSTPLRAMQRLPANVCLMFHLISLQSSLLSSSPNCTVNPAWSALWWRVCWWLNHHSNRGVVISSVVAWHTPCSVFLSL